MNSAPIEAATTDLDANGLPIVPAYQDRADPAQVERLFLEGNGLPARWGHQARFVVLAIGFGTGLSFLATWRAWRESSKRPDRLVFIAVEPNPLVRADLRALHPEGEDADALCTAWPALTHNLHRLAFERGRVQLLIAFGSTRVWLPELVAQVDAFYLDGMVDEPDGRRSKALGRLAAPGATLAAHRAAPALAGQLRTAGFQATPAPAGTVLARFAPPFMPRRAPARTPRRDDPERHAIIVGAGLAGCATACALAEQGWRSTLLDRRDTLAAEASGNPAGLFHGIVNAQDGVHARFNRAAAMSVAREVGQATADGTPGARQGLLRLERALGVEAMRNLLTRLGLPGEYVQAASADEASALAGRPVPAPAWFYPDGGWASPAGLAAHYLSRATPAAEWRGGVEVHSLERTPEGWRLRDRLGKTVAESPTVVLANACDALRLLGHPAWPIEAIRGQISAAREVPFVLPRVPIAGSGYLLPDLGHLAMFGATAQTGDADPAVRAADHRINLRQLEGLLGGTTGLTIDQLEGRTAWRCSARDRLPLVGAVPDPSSPPGRRDAPRFLPRLPGLYLITGLGSRGIAWSALGGHVLAACIAGAPVPLEASLLDAIDPARFTSRQFRRPAA